MKIKSYLIDKNGNKKFVKSHIEVGKGEFHRIVYDEPVIMTNDDTMETELYFNEKGDD
jgi:hypothetical protein